VEPSGLEFTGQWPVFTERDDPGEVNDLLFAAGLGDGLPLVVPTPSRISAALGHTPPLPGHTLTSRGHLPPMMGALTPAAVAYQCTIAGCLPGAMPVVMAALRACLDEKFNLLGLLTTTGTPAVALVVHGPIRAQLGFNSSTNCLGPGNRTNATVGRALSLSLRNIAGAREGVGDMATMGQPGKYSFCFADLDTAEMESHAAAKLQGQSGVTVFGVSGTVEVLPNGGGHTPPEILTPVAAAMVGAMTASSGGRARGLGEQLVLVPPELVHSLSNHGWAREDIQAFLFAAGAELLESFDPTQSNDRSTVIADGPGAIHVLAIGGPGVKMTVMPLWAGGTRAITCAL
jgi:hypothetical protein